MPVCRLGGTTEEPPAQIGVDHLLRDWNEIPTEAGTEDHRKRGCGLSFVRVKARNDLTGAILYGFVGPVISHDITCPQDDS
jgi:hypothetical protein